jgi:hypothetical protein
VISPWCPQNLIEHRQLEHSFIPATIEQLFGLKPLTIRDTGVTGLQTLATLHSPRNVTAVIPNPVAAVEPGGPVPGTPVGSSGAPVISKGGPVSGKIPPVAAKAAASATAPAAAQANALQALDLSDPWLASTLAVAVKAHIEAVPADAANIRARAFGLKTVGDLAQYYKDMTPIVTSAKALARAHKVAIRKQLAPQTVPVQKQAG